MTIIDRVARKIRDFASPALTIITLLISVLSLYVAYDGSKSSNAVSTQALSIAAQANDIALGRTREPSILQFSEYRTDIYTFDLLSASDLGRDFHFYTDLTNGGRKAVEGAVIEVIGVEPFTYRVDDPSAQLKQLPSTVLNAVFNSAVQPGGAVRIDVRKLILQYLEKLVRRIPDKDATYRTSVNVVVTAKGLGETIAVGAPIKANPLDRMLFTIVFKANLLESAFAKEILSEPHIQNRVFSP